MQGGERLLDRRLDAFVARPEHRRVAVSYQPVGEDHPARAFTAGSASSWSARSRISDRAAMICGSLSRTWALRKIRLACSAASSMSRALRRPRIGSRVRGAWRFVPSAAGSPRAARRRADGRRGCAPGLSLEAVRPRGGTDASCHTAWHQTRKSAHVERRPRVLDRGFDGLAVGPAHRGRPLHIGESPSLTRRSARMTPRGLTLSSCSSSLASVRMRARSRESRPRGAGSARRTCSDRVPSGGRDQLPQRGSDPRSISGIE